MDAWLATKILQVYSISHTVRDALKLVADFEGAHTNDGLPAFVAVGVKPDDVDKGATKRYRMANCVCFRCLSYIHLVVIYSGLLIIRMLQKFIEQPHSKDGGNVAGIAKMAAAVELDLSARSPIVNNCSEMIVVGKSNVAGAERKRTKYRMWSGCDEWDKLVALPSPTLVRTAACGAEALPHAPWQSRQKRLRHSPQTGYWNCVEAIAKGDAGFAVIEHYAAYEAIASCSLEFA